MNSEDFKKMIDILPKTNNTVSAYTSISVDELSKTIDRFKKIPNEIELMKENNKLIKNNEQLKKSIQELLEKNKIIFNELKDYKLRCKKTIKCIKHRYYKEEYQTKGTFTNDLLNILEKGE